VRQLRTLPGCPDHLLFICMPALAAARRRPRALATVQSLALLTAMFTVGHSASLALAALGWVTLPSRCVKTGIAITIALGALNATACIEGRILAIRWLTRCSLGVGLERERCFDPTRRLPCRKCCY
jgi:hypothetical protein